jgi:hypothetical protein
MMLVRTDENGFPMNNADYPDVRYEYSDSNVAYVGKHITMDAATSDTKWEIIKYDYFDGNVVRSRKRMGSWDGRADGWTE